MPPTKPQPNAGKRPPRKIKILQIKKSQEVSFFAEYFYQTLAVLFIALTLFCMGMKYRWDESIVIALWAVGVLFVGRQTWRLIKGEGAPGESRSREKKQEALAKPVKDYRAPEVPRVSKDFSPVPPRGVKGYPPPSPFIKPPK